MLQQLEHSDCIDVFLLRTVCTDEDWDVDVEAVSLLGASLLTGSFLIFAPGSGIHNSCCGLSRESTAK